MTRTRRCRTKMPRAERLTPQKMTKMDELDKLQEKSADLPRTDASSEI